MVCTVIRSSDQRLRCAGPALTETGLFYIFSRLIRANRPGSGVRQAVQDYGEQDVPASLGDVQRLEPPELRGLRQSVRLPDFHSETTNGTNHPQMPLSARFNFLTM